MVIHLFLNNHRSYGNTNAYAESSENDLAISKKVAC